MSDNIKLDLVDFDADGALQETAEAAKGDSRAEFFRKGAMGGAAVLGGGVLLGGFPELAFGRPSKKQDVAILNFALTLEFLESEFYMLALKEAGLTGEVLSATKIVNNHEAAHVKFLKKALGGSAVKKPKFAFGKTVQNETDFLKTAVALEDTGVTAYSGQGTRILQKSVLAAATSILTVEARHASRFRNLNSQSFAPRDFDKPASMKQVLSKAGPFIK